MRALLALPTAAFFLTAMVAGNAAGDLLPRPDLDVPLQHDGGHEGDAGDDCASAWPTLTLGQATQGMLVPQLDVADYYLLPIPASAVRTLVTVRLVEAQFDANLTVFAPGCTFNLANLTEELHQGHPGNGNGQGHTKCRGQGHLGHPECLATNVTVGDDEISFVPLQAAVFVVAATFNATAPADLLPPAPRTCHQSCLNEFLGYRLDPT